MTNYTFIFGGILLIIGVFFVHLLRKWNDKGLNTKDKKTVETIRKASTNIWSWVLIGGGVNVPILISRDAELIDFNFSLAAVCCFFAIFIVFQEHKIRKELLFTRIPISFQKTNEFVGNIFPIMLVVAGIIFLFS